MTSAPGPVPEHEVRDTFTAHRPVAVLLLPVAAVLTCHLVSRSPVGWIRPVWAAYFTVAAMSEPRRLLAAGGVRLLRSAIHDGAAGAGRMTAGGLRTAA